MTSDGEKLRVESISSLPTNRRPLCSTAQWPFVTKTDTGAEGIPLATTSSLLGPVS